MTFLKETVGFWHWTSVVVGSVITHTIFYKFEYFSFLLRVWKWESCTHCRSKEMEVLFHCKKSLRFVGLYDGFNERLRKLSVFAHLFSFVINIIPEVIYCYENANNLLVLLSTSYLLIGHISMSLIYINLWMNNSSLVATLDHLQNIVQKR